MILDKALDALDPDLTVLAHLGKELDVLTTHPASLPQNVLGRHVAIQASDIVTESISCTIMSPFNRLDSYPMLSVTHRKKARILSRSHLDSS